MKQVIGYWSITKSATTPPVYTANEWLFTSGDLCNGWWIYTMDVLGNFTRCKSSPGFLGLIKKDSAPTKAQMEALG